MFPLSPQLTSWPQCLTLAFFFRMAIAFYSLGTLDVTSMAERQISPTDRKSWKEWIWDQYVGKELTVIPCYIWGCLLCSSVVLVCVHMIIEGGFHPGPLVKVSGGDTTAAHVRLIPLPFPVSASCAPRFQDHNDNHIYAFYFPQTNIWTPQHLSNRLKPHISKTQLSFAARLATITRRRSRSRRSRSGAGDRRDRTSSDHDLLRAPRPRDPTRRLCAIGSCRAQTYGRRVSRRRRRVRIRIYLLSSTL
jgi:hypothetical protein